MSSSPRIVPSRLLLARSALAASIRVFFGEQRFVEVDTPILVRAPAPELFIEAIEVQVADSAVAKPARRRFLQTSPELGMKRLLAQGFARIYQIAAVFRDGDESPNHRPEFRLLEWYRRDADWNSGMQDCQDLLQALAKIMPKLVPDDFVLPAWLTALAQGKPIRRVRLADAFYQHAHIDLTTAVDAAALRKQLQAQQIHHAAEDDFSELFHRVLIERVEPALFAYNEPFFVTHFPAPMASLARLCPDDPLFAERFELFVGGRELANGFSECVDATSLRSRFVAERAARARAGRRDYPIDESFFAALATLPACAGTALGFERLLMALLQVDDMDALSFIPWSQA